jgi:hypothetical protein
LPYGSGTPPRCFRRVSVGFDALPAQASARGGTWGREGAISAHVAEVSDDHQKLQAGLAIAYLERTADDYRIIAATASTHSDRDSHNRVADGFERIAERRRQASRRKKIAQWVSQAGEASLIGKWSGDLVPRLSTTLSNPSGRRYHLTVERLKADKWEWLAWNAADGPGQLVQRGVTSSPGTAMVAAEDAVVTLEMASLDLGK